MFQIQIAGLALSNDTYPPLLWVLNICLGEDEWSFAQPSKAHQHTPTVASWLPNPAADRFGGTHVSSMR